MTDHNPFSELRDYLLPLLEAGSCDGTLRHTREWMQSNCSARTAEAGMTTIVTTLGVRCDCEVAKALCAVPARDSLVA